MKLIPTEERKEYRCYYCGTNKSVKYECKILDVDEIKTIAVCNACALLFKDDFIKENDAECNPPN